MNDAGKRWQFLITAAALVMAVMATRILIAQTDDAASLMKQIRTGDDSARVAAIEQATELARPSQDIADALRDLYLNDSSEQVRRAARKALAEITSKLRKGKSVKFPAGAKPVALLPAEKRGDNRTVTGLAQPGTFGFGGPTFRAEDYVDAAPPSDRVAQLMKQLATDPSASIAASGELAKLGDEALPAAQALIEVMMRRDQSWRDARLAATEALDKIFPELQKPVWTIILEDSTDMSRVNDSLGEIGQLGPRGHAALPVVLAYWNAPEETGYRVNPELLVTMHVIGLKDPAVTNEIVRVLKGQLPVGDNTLLYAIEIVDQRDLTAEQVFELITPHLPKSQLYSTVAEKLMKLADTKQIPAERVAQVFIRLLEQDVHPLPTCQHLGHLGEGAKQALPALKRVKFEHQDRRVREAAAEAINLIDR